MGPLLPICIVLLQAIASGLASNLTAVYSVMPNCRYSVESEAFGTCKPGDANTLVLVKLSLQQVLEVNDKLQEFAFVLHEDWRWLDQHAKYAIQEDRFHDVWEPALECVFAVKSPKPYIKNIKEYIIHHVSDHANRDLDGFEHESNMEVVRIVEWKVGVGGRSHYKSESTSWDTRWFPFDSRNMKIEMHMEIVRANAYNVVLQENFFANSELTEQALQKLLGDDWHSVGDLKWSIDTTTDDVHVTGTFIIGRNAGLIVLTNIYPVCCCVALCYAALWLPLSAYMPRMGVTLLALVSVSAIFQHVMNQVPSGTSSWLGQHLLAAFLAVTGVAVVHVVVIHYHGGGWDSTPDAADSAAADECNRISRNWTPVTIIILMFAKPTFICWIEVSSDMHVIPVSTFFALFAMAVQAVYTGYHTCKVRQNVFQMEMEKETDETVSQEIVQPPTNTAAEQMPQISIESPFSRTVSSENEAGTTVVSLVDSCHATSAAGCFDRKKDRSEKEQK